MAPDQTQAANVVITLRRVCKIWLNFSSGVLIRLHWLMSVADPKLN